MDKKILFYMHGGSDNHGCEAIVRSTDKMLGNISYTKTLLSHRPDKDIKYGLDHVVDEITTFNNSTRSSYIANRLKRKFLGKRNAFMDYKYKELFKASNEFGLALSIGGDNYCYDQDSRMELAYLNYRLNVDGVNTVLWGCSVDPQILKNRKTVKDISNYSLITARESLTFDAMQKAGIVNNLKLYPDPAFTLEKIELPLPTGFVPGNTIGINLSPLVQQGQLGSDKTKANYITLIKYILSQTDCTIALIPHVVYSENNDFDSLNELYNEFKHSGRVILLQDHNCLQLKGFISRCRIFIGARTHATVAAYSTCVPTLVAGYSSKSKGIAKDIFGTFEDYVVPVQTLKDDNQLLESFKFILKNEDRIRTHLNRFMPTYIIRAFEATLELRKLLI